MSATGNNIILPHINFNPCGRCKREATFTKQCQQIPCDQRWKAAQKAPRFSVIGKIGAYANKGDFIFLISHDVLVKKSPVLPCLLCGPPGLAVFVLLSGRNEAHKGTVKTDEFFLDVDE